MLACSSHQRVYRLLSCVVALHGTQRRALRSSLEISDLDRQGNMYNKKRACCRTIVSTLPDIYG